MAGKLKKKTAGSSWNVYEALSLFTACRILH